MLQGYPLLLVGMGDAQLALTEALSLLPIATRSLLRSSDAYAPVCAYLAECYLASIEVSVLTAIAATDSWNLITELALSKDVLLLDQQDMADLVACVPPISERKAA